MPKQPLHRPAETQSHPDFFRPGPLTVRVRQGRLSVALQEAKFCDVMQDIAEQSGIEIVCPAGVRRTTVTASFVKLPLAEGILRLLRGMNYAVVYVGHEAERRISQIFVISPSVVSVVDASLRPSSVSGTEAIRRVLDAQRPGDALRETIAADHDPTPLHVPIMLPQLNAVLPQVIAGQAEEHLLTEQLPSLGDELRRLLQPGRQ